jgi:toxin ParE1/3/4
MNVGFSRRAKRDLEEIFDYIATDNPEAARRVRRAILDAIELAATRPYLGIKNARSPELRSRLVTRYPYRVHYMIREKEIFIVHIRHSSRQSWHGERE